MRWQESLTAGQTDCVTDKQPGHHMTGEGVDNGRSDFGAKSGGMSASLNCVTSQAASSHAHPNRKMVKSAPGTVGIM